MEQHNKGDPNSDCDLTSLNWLTNFDHQAMKILNQFANDHEVSSKENVTPSTSKNTEPSPTKPKKPRKMKQLQSPSSSLSPQDHYETFLNKVREDLEIFCKSEHIYKIDSSLKPPFYFYRLIGMALIDSDSQLTLKQICAWIKEKFAYFRNSTKWNNSIRHNLSLHPYFCNMGRNKDPKDKDKGGYWKLGIDPKKLYRKRIRNRRSSNNPINISIKETIDNIDSIIDMEENLMRLDEMNDISNGDNTINAEIILEGYCSNEDKMESKSDTYSCVSMEDDKNNLNQEQHPLNIVTNNKELENGQKCLVEEEMIEISSPFISFRPGRSNGLPSADTTIDLAMMDINGQINHLLTCDHFPPYLNHCSLSQTSQLLCQLERIESDVSSSDISASSSTLMAQKKVPLYRARYSVNNVVGNLLTDSSSGEEASELILTPAPSLPSLLLNEITDCSMDDKNDHLQSPNKFNSTIQSCSADKFTIPLEDNTKNTNIADNSNIADGKNMNVDPSISSSHKVSLSSSSPSPSPSPSSKPLIYPTITATVRDIDYQNTYNPFVDNIDEDFYYLPNIDNRNDDILENIFGISSNDY